MTAPPQSILDRLRKIKALADQGVDGERTAAQLALDQLLAKHGVTLDQVSDQATTEYEQPYNGTDERKLFAQIAAQALNTRKPMILYTKKAVFVICTAAQWIDIRDRFAHYLAELRAAKRALSKQRRLLLSAMIQRHGIFPETKGDESDRELTEKEKREIRELFEAMQRLRTAGFSKPAPRIASA